MHLIYTRPCCLRLTGLDGTAQAVCFNGSQANQNDVNDNCLSGATAGGAGCSFGQIPNQVGCGTGNNPYNFGCIDGLAANPNCIVGTSALVGCTTGSTK